MGVDGGALVQRGAVALGLLFYPLEDGAGQGRLWRSDLDGDDRVAIVDGIEEVSDIEIDVTGGKVYWSEQSGSIRRAGLDGTAPETLVIANTPRALALRERRYNGVVGDHAVEIPAHSDSLRTTSSCGLPPAHPNNGSNLCKSHRRRRW